MNPQNQPQHERVSRPQSVTSIELYDRLSRLNRALVVMEQYTRAMRQVLPEQTAPPVVSHEPVAAVEAPNKIVDLQEYRQTPQNPLFDQPSAPSIEQQLLTDNGALDIVTIREELDVIHRQAAA